MPFFRPTLADRLVKPFGTPSIVQSIIKDLDDSELGCANDEHSAWDLIEAEWPDAVAVSLDGTRARGWMLLVTPLEKAGKTVVVRYNRQVGSVILEDSWTTPPPGMGRPH